MDVNNAIKLKPKDEKLYLLRISIYELQKNTAEIINDYNKILEINPDNFQILIARGKFLWLTRWMKKRLMISQQ